MMEQVTQQPITIIDEMIQVEERIVNSLGNIHGDSDDVLVQLVKASNWRLDKLRTLRNLSMKNEEVN
jgi:hypothetical protein